jgi:F-type H+-transporting ATPase subunit c
MTGNLAVLATLGAGLCVAGGAVGIGKLAAAFMEGTARQPSASAELRVGLIMATSFIESLGLFGLLICMLAALK